MKLRHPETGAIYTAEEGSDVVHVEHEGKTGVFRLDGAYVSGDVRDADMHFIGWVGGPKPESRTGPRGVAVAQAPSAPPQLKRSAVRGDAESDPQARSQGMDLGLNGRKAIVTAASRGIGLSIAQHLADEGVDVACGEGLLRLLQVQPPGKRAMRAGDFANGRALAGLILE